MQRRVRSARSAPLLLEVARVPRWVARSLASAISGVAWPMPSVVTLFGRDCDL